MTWWNSLDAWRKKALLVAVAVIVGGVIVACSVRQTNKPANGTGPSEPAASNQPREHGDPGAVADAASRDRHKQNNAIPSPPTPPKVQPLSSEAEARLRAQVAAASDHYPARIESRRALLYALARADRADEAVAEFKLILDDIEATEGPNMAQRAAMADAGTLQAQNRHQSAVNAYELILVRWPDSPFAAEALVEIGNCRLELRAYAAAERAWRRVIEEFDATPSTPGAWRKLALVQLLQGHYDESLATLATMGTKYAGTENADYAKARRGYVLMVAGRNDQALAAYDVFLGECKDSKYCALVRQQKGELEGLTAVARSNGRHP